MSLLKFKCVNSIIVALHTFIQSTSTEISNIQSLGEECLWNINHNSNNIIYAYVLFPSKY